MAEEYWLLAVPCITSKDEAYNQLNGNTSEFASNCRFNIPELKVGTLDALVALSDELSKHDTFGESVVKKLSQLLSDLLEDHKEKLAENLLVNEKEPAAYLKSFEWDLARYPIKSSIQELTDILTKQLSQIENGMKSKLATYNQLKGNLQVIERKATGNLLVKSLHDIVKKEHFVLDSEYLVTLLVAVPKASVKDWLASYETLTQMVVPRSSKLIAEDNEYALYTVTVFQRIADEYKMHAREKKFTVRDYKFVEQDIEMNRKEKADMENDLKRQWSTLVRWAKTNFSESFTAWTHIKALRLFVESVLRYGLPVNFQGALMKPNKKTEKKLEEMLYRLYGYLDKSVKRDDARGAELAGVYSNQEFHPWVMVKLSLRFNEKL